MLHRPSQDPVDAVRQRLAKALSGRYALEGQSGWGGMALVFRARDLRHTRTVAIKVIRPELTTTTAAQRFLDEVRIAARLQHPHIVPLYDSGEADGLVFFVMPYIEGETLRDRMDRDERLSPDAALAVTRDVADALGCAHEAGIVHRDVKPENVLLAGGHALVADFGVALAVFATVRDERTDPGLAVGTYSYMSPEQASGSNGVDGRADIYALGCMLYEMLSGNTPWTDVQERLYGGAATQEMPPLGSAAVPEHVTQALSRALAIRAADRYATIGEFAEALALSGVPRGALRSTRRRAPRWLAAAAVVAIAVTAVVGGFATGSGIEASRYIVAPCGGDSSAIGGEYCQLRLAEALAQWDEVRAVDPFEALDALRRDGLDRADSEAWYAVAQETRAGRLVRTELARVGDTTYPSGRIYDGERRRPIGPTHRVLLAVGDSVLPNAFASLGGALLGLGDPARQPGLLGTRSLEAGRAYAEGHIALAVGNFRVAQDRFGDAARFDATFGDAIFWQAQITSWLGDPVGDFQLGAERALAFAPSLRDSLSGRLAPALAALGREDYAAACDLYRDLVAADSSAFTGWLGLADCLTRDRLVVESADSPSGFAFRASWQEAQTALRAALVREPGFIGPLWPRVLAIVTVSASKLRPGRRVGDDRVTMVALPDQIGDTAHFVPYTLTALHTGDMPFPAAADALLRTNRRFLRALANDWVGAYPLDGRAHLALAEASELIAMENPSEENLGEVLAEAVRARELGFDSIAVAATGVRALFRLGRYAEVAEAIADLDPRATDDPELVAGLAALGGRTAMAADTYERATFSGLLPLRAQRTQLRLDAFAGVGAPADSVRVLLGDLVAMISGEVPAAGQDAARFQYLEYLRLLALPTLGPDPALATAQPHSRGERWVALLVAGDADGLRLSVQQLQEERRDKGWSPGGSPMFAWLEQWLMAQAGDTAAALGGLDIFLGRLPSVPRLVFAHPADAAGIVRAMALRADLALAVGDRPTAERWARSALALWRHADPAARQSVARLEAMIPRPQQR